jgi:putative oxygen-independent coproporphyrinogen III oxidase
VAPDAPIDPRTGLSAARFAVYVHFPFCLSKCPYCDFASIAARQVPERAYTRAVLRELELRGPALEGQRVDSVFVGGGTPSLWSPGLVGEVLSALAGRLRLADRAEVTLEANPGAADAARFQGYRAAGVNRLSMGVQSFEATTLAALGRAHDGPTARRAFAAARQAGFDNVSLDFIYGVHGQSLAQVEADARAAVALGPEHLSAYALTLDRESLAEEVPLARALRRGEVALPPDEVVVAMQRTVAEVYAAAGLERYEVSNHARPGLHSRHNAVYWTGGDWLALGVGATGTLALASGERVRYANLRSADAYLARLDAGQLPEASREALTGVMAFEERVAMGLRLTRGVDLEAVCADFGQPYPPRRAVVERLLAGGLARWQGRRLALTERGLDVHSAVSAALM